MSEEKEIDIEKLRADIDRADAMLLMSFATRMNVARSIAEYKEKNGLPVLDAEREKEKLDEIRRQAPKDIEEECVLLYNKIMEISRDYQQKLIDADSE